MNWKKTLNLNTYEWWRNHRRFVTLGLLLALFSSYIRTPSANDFKIRDTCARLQSSFQITGKEAMKVLKLKSIQDYDKRIMANDYCERYLGIE